MSLQGELNRIETVDQPEGGEASSNYVLPDPAVGRNQRLDLWIVTRQQEQKKERYRVRLIDKGCSREERGKRDGKCHREIDRSS